MPQFTSSARMSLRNIVEGLLPIGIAFVLTTVYFLVPAITKTWSVSGHVLFRGFVVLIGLVGVLRLSNMFALNHSRLPGLMVTQHRMFIPLEGWIYLGILITLFTGSMLTRQNTLLMVFALMAGPFVINGWMTFGMLQSAIVQRQIPRRAMQGELFSVEIPLRNSRPLFSLWMMSIRDEIAHAQEFLHANVLFSRVSPRKTATGEYQLRLAHRGRYRFGPLRCASRFPLGLVERSRIFPLANELLVYPRIGRVLPNWRQRLEGAMELVSRSQPRHGIFHDDFSQLREFRSGDNPRAIHWRSTARRGELILREFQQNRERPLAIVLDLFKPPQSNPLSNPPSDDDKIDFALSFVTSLLVGRGRENRDADLMLVVTGAEGFQWNGRKNAETLESLFDGLASINPGSAADIASILQETSQSCSAAVQILLVTTRSSPRPYDSLLTPRIDVLDLSLLERDQLLLFDDDA